MLKARVILVSIIILMASISCTSGRRLQTRLVTGDTATQAVIDSLQQQIQDCEDALATYMDAFGDF